MADTGFELSERGVAEGLRAALSSSGLTQTAFAAALGTSQSRLSTYLSGRVSPSASLFVRARHVGEALAGISGLHLLSAPTMGVALREALSKSDRDWAFRLLMQARDHLQLVLAQHPDLRVGWVAAPLSSGRLEWDTLAAAVSSREFIRIGLEPPAWTLREPLPEPWTFPSALLDPDEVRTATPEWLARLSTLR